MEDYDDGWEERRLLREILETLREIRGVLTPTASIVLTPGTPEPIKES